MALNPPPPIDCTDVQFKLQNKVDIFVENEHATGQKGLLVVASTLGLLIVGGPQAELKVIHQTTLVNAKNNLLNVAIRSVPLPSVPLLLALNCDNTLLAVDYLVQGVACAVIYSVQSFLENEVRQVETIRLSPDVGIHSRQILWNPVIPGILSICLENGSLSTYALKDKGFELYSIEKTEQARCACWSPKGKQLAVGFSNGKIVQFKPDLKPARILICPPHIHLHQFEIIAIQWLSNYQFAAVFLQNDVKARPALYIINAPKAGPAMYINYDDICYSTFGPQATHVYLMHISSWNLLLVASANSMEVGVLGTQETGDTPLWKQYIMMDEARAEMPLTSKRQESFPLGVCIDTGTTHQVVIGEVELPIMPVLHMLSTHGCLITFNLLNMDPKALLICSPPTSIANQEGYSHFKPIGIPINSPLTPICQNVESAMLLPQAQPERMFSQAINTPITSSVARPSLLQATSTQSGSTSLFNLGNSSTSSLGSEILTMNNVPSNAVISPIFQPKRNLEPPITQTTNASLVGGLTYLGQKPQIFNKLASASVSSAPTPFLSKPKAHFSVKTTPNALISVSPYFQVKESNKNKDISQSMTKEPTITLLSDDENEIKKMVAEEIESFDQELADCVQMMRSVKVDIAVKGEISSFADQISELHNWYVMATENIESLSSEIQALRLSLNEAFSMVAEAKSKHSLVLNPEFIQLQDINFQSGRRHIQKLKSQLAIHDKHLNTINNVMNDQWSTYQDSVNDCVKTKMHVPRIENVYLILNSQKEILTCQKIQLIKIMKVLASNIITDTDKLSEKRNEKKIVTVTDSILSLNLYGKVQAVAERLSDSKLDLLRKSLAIKSISHINTSCPTRRGISSKVIREKRVQPQFGEKLQPNILPGADVKSNQNLQPKPDFFFRPTNSEFIQSNSLLMQQKTDDLKQPIIGFGSEPEDMEIGKKTFAFKTKSKSIQPYGLMEMKATPRSTGSDNANGTSTIPFGSLSASQLLYKENKQKMQSVSFEQLESNTASLANSITTQTIENNFESSDTNHIPEMFSSSKNTSPTIIIPNLSVTSGPTQNDFANLSTNITSKENVLIVPSGTAAVTSPFEKIESISNITPNQDHVQSKSMFSFVDALSNSGVTNLEKSIAKATSEVTTKSSDQSTSTLSLAISPINSFVQGLSICKPIGLETLHASTNKAANSFSFMSSLNEVPSLTATSSTPLLNKSTFDAAKPFSFCGTSADAQEPKTTPSNFESLLTNSSIAATNTSRQTLMTLPLPLVKENHPTSNRSTIFQPSIEFDGNHVSNLQSALPASTVSECFSSASKFASAELKETEYTTLQGQDQSEVQFSQSAAPVQFSFATVGTSNELNQPKGIAQTSVFEGFNQPAASKLPNTAFGTAVTTSPLTDNSFTSSTVNHALSGGSLFSGTSSFGSCTKSDSGNSIFGGANVAKINPGFGELNRFEQQNRTDESSIFGGQTTFSASFSGPSTFGPNTSVVVEQGFGSSSPSFSNQTGFAGAPTFGGPATFGSPSTFGAAAPSFADSKTAFGGFGIAPANRQQNNLFESLGSTETGMTFGNLAQNTVPNQQKNQPGFGGSAFSTWR